MFVGCLCDWQSFLPVNSKLLVVKFLEIDCALRSHVWVGPRVRRTSEAPMHQKPGEGRYQGGGDRGKDRHGLLGRACFVWVFGEGRYSLRLEALGKKTRSGGSSKSPTSRSTEHGDAGTCLDMVEAGGQKNGPFLFRVETGRKSGLWGEQRVLGGGLSTLSVPGTAPPGWSTHPSFLPPSLHTALSASSPWLP